MSYMTSMTSYFPYIINTCVGIFSGKVLFKHQRNPFLLAVYCYSWNCFSAFFLLTKKRKTPCLFKNNFKKS